MTIPEIFTFLYSTCGKTPSIDLESNEKIMTKVHNGESLFGMLIKQIDDAVEHVDAGGENSPTRKYSVKPITW